MDVAHYIIMKFTVSMVFVWVPQTSLVANIKVVRPLSAEEILAQLPKGLSRAKFHPNLKRLLGALAREGVFSESTIGEGKPVYGLTWLQSQITSCTQSLVSCWEGLRITCMKSF